MRTPNVLVMCVAKIPSVNVGVLNTLEAMQNQGKLNVKFMITASITVSDLEWCDTLISVRGSEMIEHYYISLCRKNGKLTVYFLDDDLLHIPVEASCSKYYHTRNIMNNIRKIMTKAEVLWCVNPNIATKYSYLFSKVICTKGSVRDTQNFWTKGEEEPVKILYAGGVDHTKNIERLCSPIIQELCQKYGDKVEFTFIGANPEINLPQVRFFPYMECYMTYRNFVENEKFDIAFAMILETNFYRCKYYNKFIEYSSIGAAGIYTRTEPYTLVIKERKNGLMADTSKEWYKAFEYLIENVGERNEIRKNAYQEVKENFCPERVGNELENGFPELFIHLTVQNNMKYCKAFRVVHLVFTYWQKICVFLQIHGAKGIFLLPKRTIEYCCKKKKRTEE